jgi:hypothetical protein
MKTRRVNNMSPKLSIILYQPRIVEFRSLLFAIAKMEMNYAWTTQYSPTAADRRK